METQARILVVDDNEMNRDVLARRLERQGHSVSVAEDGVSALEMVDDADFDLILLDIMMPRMNGYEVLETLKSNPDKRGIPVIVISALDELESVVKCIELGAEDYLFKPFNPVLLRARLNAIIDRRRYQSQQEAQNQILGQFFGALRQQIDDLIRVGEPSMTSSHTQKLNEIRAAVENVSQSML